MAISVAKLSSVNLKSNQIYMNYNFSGAKESPSSSLDTCRVLPIELFLGGLP